MAITYGFFNALQQSDGTYDRVYNSDQISNMFEGLISDGVYESVGNALIVKASSGLTVQVGTGRMIISGKWLKNDATVDITLAASHLTLNRWSAIVCRLDATNRVMTIVEKAGSPATNPTKPTMTNSSTIKEKCLAYVYVKAGATSVSQSDITDSRADTSVCGWVTGLITQVDTSQLFLQWQTAYENMFAQMQAWETQQKAAFDTWFATLTDQLQVNTYIKRYHKTVDMKQNNGIFPLDMDGYTYSDTDILLINVNGVMLTEVYDYLLDTSKTPVEIHTNATLEAENILEITVLKSQIGQA
nr:MAG TPA: Receptor Binding Protein [Caudoviricetes sp.]